MLSRGYNTHGTVSPRNKKKDKAHVKIRDRMRKKIHASSVLKTRLHNPESCSLHNDPTSRTRRCLPATIPTINDQAVSPKKSLLYRDGYWRTQQDRYDNMVHTGNPTIGRHRDNESIQSLMNRMIERNRHTQPVQNNSLLTIRSYKRPIGPYAIQQQPLIKKMVDIAPIPRGKPQKKGPYVLVLQTNKNEKCEKMKKSKEANGLTVVVPSNDEVLSDNHFQTITSGSEFKLETQPLPAIHTWKPNLQSIPKPVSLVESDDRGVTNYKLELQQANRLAESRFQFSAHTMIERDTLQTFSALPSIPKSVLKERLEAASRTESCNSDISNKENYHKQEDTLVKELKDLKGKEIFKSRKSNSNEILEIMEAKKQARRGKTAETDFKTLLRTRNRYTSDTKVFKDDLSNMSRLSIISEGNSQTSENHGRVSSAKRTNSSTSIASLKSVSSLEKIDEAKIVKDTVGERALVSSTKSPSRGIYLIHEETESWRVNGSGQLYAPPTTPVAFSEDGDTKITEENDENYNSSQQEEFQGMIWISGDEEFVEVI